MQKKKLTFVNSICGTLWYLALAFIVSMSNSTNVFGCWMGLGIDSSVLQLRFMRIVIWSFKIGVQMHVIRVQSKNVLTRLFKQAHVKTFSNVVII